MRVHWVVLAVFVACAALPLSAHHCVRENFDIANLVTLSGVITRVDLRNPHTTLELTTKDANGKMVAWTIELAPPNALKRNVDIGALAIGSAVLVDAWLAKNGDKLATGRSLTTADGKTYGMGGNYSPGMDWCKQPQGRKS